MHFVLRGIKLTIENKVNKKSVWSIYSKCSVQSIKTDCTDSTVSTLTLKPWMTPVVVSEGPKLEGCDEVVCRVLVAVCLLVVRLNLFMLLLDDLPHFLL